MTCQATGEATLTPSRDCGVCAVCFSKHFKEDWYVPELRERSRLLAEIGANIRRLRVGSKRSQQTLSELADLDLRTIQRIEAGKIDVLLRTLDKIRRALDCDWKDILPRGGKP